MKMTKFKWFFIKEQTGRKIVLFPGSFKPPHLGHVQLIENFKKKVGNDGVVNVIVTEPSPKSRRYTPGGKYIPADVAADILRRYVEEVGIRGVTINTAKNAVGEVYDFVRTRAQPGDHIIVGVGGKGDDKSRYSGILKGVPAGVNIDIDVADVVEDESGALSASSFREKLDNLAMENLLPYIPKNLRNNKNLVGYVYDKLRNLPSD